MQQYPLVLRPVRAGSPRPPGNTCSLLSDYPPLHSLPTVSHPTNMKTHRLCPCVRRWVVTRASAPLSGSLQSRGKDGQLEDRDRRTGEAREGWGAEQWHLHQASEVWEVFLEDQGSGAEGVCMAGVACVSTGSEGCSTAGWQARGLQSRQEVPAQTYEAVWPALQTFLKRCGPPRTTPSSFPPEMARSHLCCLMAIQLGF